MSSPVTRTGISAITDRRHLDGVWKAGGQLQATPVDGSSLASITYNDGKEIRVYYHDTNYIVQELCHTDGKGWYQGGVGNMKAKATPGSDLAAIVLDESYRIRVYYQESGTNTVKELAYDDSWYIGGLSIRRALSCTSLAAFAFYAGRTQIRVYYQDQGSRLNEHASEETRYWVRGAFNPGKAATNTPLAAVSCGDIRVYWRDLEGRIVFSKFTGGWGGHRVIEPIEPGYRFAVLQWDSGEHIRLYTQLLNGSLAEYCSDDSGDTWSLGKFQLR